MSRIESNTFSFNSSISWFYRSEIIILYQKKNRRNIFLSHNYNCCEIVYCHCHIEVTLDIKPEIITAERNPWTVHFFTSYQGILFWIYAIIDMVSFIAVLIALILLTKQYVSNVGKLKYMIVISFSSDLFSSSVFSFTFSSNRNIEFFTHGRRIFIFKFLQFCFEYWSRRNGDYVWNSIFYAIQIFSPSAVKVYSHDKWHRNNDYL